MRQTAYKPGSVHRIATAVWPFLWDVRCRTPHATYPDGYPETDEVPSLFGLAPGGLAMPVSLPKPRCALTAPFHHRRDLTIGRLTLLCGAIPRFPSPDVIRHRVSVEPGLSSTTFMSRGIHHLTRGRYRATPPFCHRHITQQTLSAREGGATQD